MGPCLASRLPVLAVLVAVSCGRSHAAPWLLTIRNGPFTSFSQMDLAFETASATLPSLITSIYPSSTFVFNGKRGKFLGLLPVNSWYNDNVLNSSTAPFWKWPTPGYGPQGFGLGLTADFGAKILLHVQVNGFKFEIYSNTTPYYTTYAVDAQLSKYLQPTSVVPTTTANWRIQIRNGYPDGYAQAEIYFETDKPTFPATVISVDTSRSTILAGGTTYKITGLAAPNEYFNNDNKIVSNTFPYFTPYNSLLPFPGVAFTTNKPVGTTGFQTFGMCADLSQPPAKYVYLFAYDYISGSSYQELEVNKHMASTLIPVAKPPPPPRPPPPKPPVAG